MPILIGGFAAASFVLAPTCVAATDAAASVSGSRIQRNLRIDTPPPLSSWYLDT